MNHPALGAALLLLSSAMAPALAKCPSVPAKSKSCWGSKALKPANGTQPVAVVMLQPDDPFERTHSDLVWRDGAHLKLSRLTNDRPERGGTGIKLPRLAAGVASSPTVTYSANGTMQLLFVLGADQRIHQTLRVTDDGSANTTARWRPWRKMPGSTKLASRPVAINAPDGKSLLLFAATPSGRVYHTRYERQRNSHWWPEWKGLPPGPATDHPPAVYSTPDGSLTSAIITDRQGRLHQSLYFWAGGGWTPWKPLPKGPTIRGPVSALNTPDGSLLSLIGRSAAGTIHQLLYLRRKGGSKWLPWKQVGNVKGFSEPPVTFNSPDGERLYIYARAKDGRVRTSHYQRGRGSHWTPWRMVGKVGGAGPIDAMPALIPRISRRALRAQLFGNGKSVRRLLEETTYGKFSIKEAFVTPWITAQDDPKTRGVDESSYTFVHTSDLKKKSAWIIQQAAKRGYNLARYDRNRDGLVTDDELTILWVYPKDRNEGRVRGVDPKRVRVPGLRHGVAVSGVARFATGASVHTMAHEIAHVRFDTADMYKGNGFPGDGGWSLMGNQGTHFDAWHKYKLGWLKPTIISRSGTYSLAAVETTPTAHIICTGRDDRYFMVENRLPSLSALEPAASGGLVVWQVNEAHEGGNWLRKAVKLVPRQAVSRAGAPWAKGKPGPKVLHSPTGEFSLTPLSGPGKTMEYRIDFK